MRMSLLGVLLAAGVLAACNSESATSPAPVSDGSLVLDGQAILGQQQTLIAAAVGQEILVHLGTVGPGAFDSLPVISASRLRFLDATYIGPYLPSGPQQLFRFVATAPGRVVISFPHSEVYGSQIYHVVDTVDVR